MKVSTKLNLAFFSMIAIMVIMGLISFSNLGNIEEKQEYALDHRVERILLVDEMRYNLANQGLFLRAYFLENTDKNRENLQTYAAKLDENIATLKAGSSAQSIEMVEALEQHNIEFNEFLDEAISAIEAKDTATALSYINGPLQEANIKLSQAALELLESQKQGLAMTKEETSAVVSFSKLSSGIAILIGIGIAIFLVFFVKRQIVNPLNGLKEKATYIAEGDLSREDIKVHSKDEIGELARIFNDMKANLRGLIRNVQDNSEQLSAAAEELSASVEEVSATTEDVKRQADQSSEVAKSSSQASGESARAMEETAHGVQRIAEASQMLHSSSVDASDTATHGAKIIHQAKTQMLTINDSTTMVNELVQKLAQQTEEIEIITKAITDITDQTNLLALNASIEAARAGEHGKGFAVVADEVKKLAEQSKGSANSIVELTAEIQRDTGNVASAVSQAIDSVQQGVSIITEAGVSFGEITSAVDDMTTQIQEISATAEQLSASAEEVTASVNEIANGAELSATSIDSIASAMEEQAATMHQVSGVAVSLADNAADLQSEIQRFKV